MRVIHSFVLLACACVSAAISTKSVLKQKIVFDVTKPLESILENTTKIKSYIENLVEQNFYKGRDFLLFYNIDCSASIGCADSFPKAKHVLTVVRNRTDLNLILSITLPPGITDEALATDWLNFNRVQSSSQNELLFNFHKNISCQKLSRLYTSFTLNSGYRGPSICYDEDLSNCENLAAAITEAYPFIVVHYSFGSTTGVTESFGLFKKRLRFLHSRQQEFIKEAFSRAPDKAMPTILYYLTEENVGDYCHQQLLAKYMEKLVEDGSQEFGLIVPAPSVILSAENVNLNGFTKLATSITKRDLKSPGRIKEISKRFNPVLIEYKDWKNVWRSGTQHSLFSENLKNTSDIKLEMIMEFPGMTSAITKEAESELAKWQAGNPFPNFFVGTLLFNINSNNSIITSPVEKFANQLSSNFTVGCVVLRNFMNSSAAKHVVDSCNRLNGSLYVLKTILRMDRKDVLPGKYTFYYENTIRNKLEQMKAFGKLILQQKPAASLMLSVLVKPKYTGDYETISNFCNEKLLYLNEYYEAVTNWANCNNIRTVLKSPIADPLAQSSTTWLSYVTPYLSSSYFQRYKLYDAHPYFVFRNHPNNANNWTVDPCIHWKTVRPDYNNISNIGAVFYTNIRQNEQLAANEHKIMLQFILYRFDVVEILLPNITGDLIEAFNWLESQNNSIYSNSIVLLNYGIPRSDMDPMSRKESGFGLDALEKIRWGRIQGIHFDFSTNGSMCNDGISNAIVSTKALLAKTQRMKFRFGITLDYICCTDLIKLLVFQNDSSQQVLSFLERINYLVCQEDHHIMTLGDMEVMGNVLDSQLYIRKGFQEFSPKLELYSRVILTDLPSSEGAYSDDYMRTISYFMQFGTAYDIKYLIIEAFDGEITKNGWWKIQNFTDLSDPLTFVEKEAEAINQITWRPEPLKEEPLKEPVENSQVFLLSAAGILLAICLALSAYFYLRYKKIKQFLSDEEVKDFVNGRSTGVRSPSTEVSGGDAEYMQFKTGYKLHISDLHIDILTILGKGNFGTVYKGTVKEMPAAIKTPNKNCSKACFKSVLCEVKVMCYIGEHSNIVRFIGAYTNEIQRGVLYIATEFCANGSLETFLRKKNTVVSSQDEHALLTIPERESALFFEDLCRFSAEIASGMEHLDKKHVVHGDLSVRNVLLDENYTCKIADFGLSRKLYDYQKYVKTSQEPLPWKWMAYETLAKMEFTSKSDVWSYGVTVWEIFSLGKIPYSALNWTLDFPDELKNGLRLGKPEFACQEIYMKLLDCWILDPAQRPTFKEILGFFTTLNKTEYVILDEA